MRQFLKLGARARVGQRFWSLNRGLSLVFATFMPLGVWAQSGWSNDYMEPCACDETLEQTIPAVFANRLPGGRETALLDNLVSLIDGFTKSQKISNDRKYIYWTVYELGAFDIVNALVRAQEAGVRVFLVTDGKSVLTKPPAPPKSPPTDEDADDGDQTQGATVGILQDRHLLTREAISTLRKAGVQISYSDPEFEPISTSYPPIMHEKVRIFATRPSNRIEPLFAYVSTHNDTYSETVGDPLAKLNLDRLKRGKLTREDLEPGSRGNIQTAFILRNQKILQSLLKNARDQVETYKQGKGRIVQVENQKPQTFELGDGTRIRLTYTYAKSRSAYNPNIQIKEFFDYLGREANGSAQVRGHIQQFVFSYSGASETLKDFLTQNPKSSLRVWIDGSFAFEPYSQGRKMAGLYTVRTYSKRNPIDFPWRKELRSRVQSLAYVNTNDKLHTKNASFKYLEPHSGKVRHRIYTGSLNLSSNAVSNKEVFFEIDTPSKSFAELLESQAQFVEGEGYLRSVAEGSLFRRVRKAADVLAGQKVVENDPRVQTAFNRFLQMLTKSQKEDFLAQLNFGNNYYFLESDFTEPAWLESMGDIYEVAGADKAEELVTESVRKNLQQTKRFYASVPSVDILMHITENEQKIDPEVRQAIIDLF